MLATDQVLNKGRYRIVNTFKQDAGGGMYEAYDTVSNTNVVLRETVGSLGKVTTTSQMEAINLAFVGGARTLAESRHESLVSVQDYFADIDRQYLVLEPVADLDLAKYMDAGHDRPELTEVLSWADQLLDALQHLHSRPTPIIHGDLRPENVKLAADSKVKLLVSCPHVDADVNLITLAPIRSSEDGGVNYRPLEQLWDGLDALSQRVILNHYDEESERWLLQPLSAATDLYSLAATLYAVLTGTVPADALDRSIAALEDKADPLISLAEANPAVPDEVSNVIMKAMSLRREDRFYSAVILRQILHAATARVKEREQKTVPVNEVSPPPDMPPMLSNSDAIQIEIEAEGNRLEQEKIALEMRQAELDAEVTAQKAEHEKLEREAADERQHLEQESKTAQDEAKKASDLASKETSSALRNLSADLDEEDEDLLEVPKAPVPRSPITLASLPTQAAEKMSDFVMPDSDHEPSGSKWRLPAVAVAFVLIAAASFDIWKMSSGGSTAVSTSVSGQPALMPQQSEAAPPADTQKSVEPTQASVVDTQPLLSAPVTVTDRSPKTAIPTTVQEKPKKTPTPAPAKTPAPKKAVTVDDLINDH